MKKFNYIQNLLLFFFIFLPIYPNNNSIDFGGFVDPSLVIIILFLLMGINLNRILALACTAVFYLYLSDYTNYIDFSSKILVFISSAYFIKKYYWENSLNNIILIFSFLFIYYSINLFAYKIIFHVDFFDYLAFVTLPFIYNAIVSIILLFMIRYTSWPKYPEKVSQY